MDNLNLTEPIGVNLEIAAQRLRIGKSRLTFSRISDPAMGAMAEGESRRRSGLEKAVHPCPDGFGTG
jgi:hypothetical protein